MSGTRIPEIKVFYDANGVVQGIECPWAQQSILADNNQLPGEYVFLLPQECGGIFRSDVPCKPIRSSIGRNLASYLRRKGGAEVFEAASNMLINFTLNNIVTELRNLSVVSQARIILLLTIRKPDMARELLEMKEFESALNMLRSTYIIDTQSHKKVCVLNASRMDKIGVFIAMGELQVVRGENKPFTSSATCKEGWPIYDSVLLKDNSGNSYTYGIERSGQGKKCGSGVILIRKTYIPDVEESSSASEAEEKTGEKTLKDGLEVFFEKQGVVPTGEGDNNLKETPGDDFEKVIKDFLEELRYYEYEED